MNVEGFLGKHVARDNGVVHVIESVKGDSLWRGWVLLRAFCRVGFKHHDVHRDMRKRFTDQATNCFECIAEGR